LDERLVEQGRALASAAGVEAHVHFERADATKSESYVGRVPCELVLACGVLGNIARDTTRSFIKLASAACASGGTLVWTRVLSANAGATHAPLIRDLLTAATFDEIKITVVDADEGHPERLTETFGAGRILVASHVHRGVPGPLPRSEIFRFVGFQTLLKES